METQTWRKGDIVGNGRFEILQELGAGGFGITYLAYDRVKKQQIAIKTLNSNQQREGDFAVRQKKFEDEEPTLRGFRHPHIVRVYEKVEINGLLGFTMEYIPGQDLAKYVKAKGRLSEAESLRYIDQISLALDYVHQDTFLHRDVNPRNIMLRQDRPEAVLIDFGLAREFAELEPIYLSNTDGSELYKPVEQYEKRGVFGPSTDIYALAVTLYYLLNGAPLGSGKNWIAFTSIARKMNYERGLGQECDRELWAELINIGVSARTLAAIQAGMTIEPEQRPKNMTEFRELLGLVPATSLPEIFTTSQPIQNSPELPVVVMHNAENLSFGLTSSIPTESKNTKDAQSLLKSIVTTSGKESESPGSISSPAKSTRGIQSKKESHQPKSLAVSKTVVSRRMMLRGLTVVSGFTSFSIIAWVLKSWIGSKVSSTVENNNSLEPQPLNISEQANSPETNIFSEPSVTPSPKTRLSLKTINFITVKLNNQGEIIAKQNRAAQVYHEDLGNGVTLTMVKIPAGSFVMGSYPREQYGRIENENPQHTVSLKAFYIGQTEITISQYQAIMGGKPTYPEYAQHAVQHISWLDAQDFCEKLSQKTGKTYGLPSESQWEYACRSKTTTPFSFGDTITTDVANYSGRYSYNKEPDGVVRLEDINVAAFPPNAFGLFDMHGNVWEWCQDIWHETYEGAPTNGDAWTTKDSNNSNGSKNDRVLRGGGSGSHPRELRSANRYNKWEDYKGDDIGFRVICIHGL
jgi:formylglycine-generating enzyme required for sulfatase activity